MLYGEIIAVCWAVSCFWDAQSWFKIGAAYFNYLSALSFSS
jgi:hypothetical protein